MPETYNYDLWREEEKEDSWSSSDADLYLESSNDTEIITVPVEHVPHVPEADRTFLWERLLIDAYRRDMENMLRWIEIVQAAQQDGGALQQDGGALGSATVQYTDDTVETVQTQDTQTAPDTDTMDTVSPADTDRDQDTNITQT